MKVKRVVQANIDLNSINFIYFINYKSLNFKLLAHTCQNRPRINEECLFTIDNTRRTGGNTLLHKMQRATSTNAMMTKDKFYTTVGSFFTSSREPITMEHSTNSLTRISENSSCSAQDK